jgi:hypothetical protein
VAERVIVIEQRLHSGGVALAIGGITFLFILVSTIFLETGSGSLPAVAIVIELVALAGLVSVTLIFSRVIVRVVQTGDGRALEVVYGPGGRVRQVFEPSEVEAAYARHLSFAEMGAGGTGGVCGCFVRRRSSLDVATTSRYNFRVDVDSLSRWMNRPTSFLPLKCRARKKSRDANLLARSRNVGMRERQIDIGRRGVSARI